MAPSRLPTATWKQLCLWLLIPALILRVFTIVYCGSDPVVRFPFEDGLSYSKWALEISEGDWLGRARPVFYQAPLYPYVLAGLQTIGLGMWPGPQLLNCVAGTLTVMFVFLATHRLFGRTPAFVAGAIAALWGPALMYECLIDKTALGLCLSAGGLWAVIWLADRLDAGTTASLRSVLLVGALFGAGSLLRENFLVLAPVAAIALGLRARSWRVPAVLVSGVVLGLAPALLHNGIAGGEWLPTTYQGGTNLWIGNNPNADGTYTPLVAGRSDPIYEEADARRLAAAALSTTPDEVSASAVNRYWVGRTLSFVASDPLGWLGLMMRKAAWFAFHAEAPDSVPYLGFRAGRVWLLPSRILFGLLLPLVLVGAWLARGDRRARLALWLAAAACGSVVLFYVVSRYRLACLPFLLPFAALAACRLRAAPKPVLAACLALLVPAQVWLCPRPPDGMSSNQQQALLMMNRGTALALWVKDKDKAIAAYGKALAIEPDLSSAHQSIARLLMAPDRKDFQGALPHCEASVRALPESVEARHNLGFCLAKLSRLGEAEQAFRKTIELAGDKPPAITVQQLARCLSAMGKRADAERLLARYGVAAPPGS